MRYVAKISLVSILGSLLGLAALFLVQLRFASLYREHDQTYGAHLRNADLARTIQVDLKKQVQEWKNILLRGHEPEEFERYSEQFFALEEKVRKTTAELASRLTDPAALRDLDEFSTAHEQMGASYREALELFVAVQDSRRSDGAVRGQDRAPTDLIDNIVSGIAAQSATWQARASETLAVQQLRIRWLSAGFFAGLIGVALYCTLRFTSPIVHLYRLVQQISQHRNFSVRAACGGDDEVARLAQGINGMLDEVESGRSKLQKSRDELEMRVAERTRELAEKEEQFRALSNSVSDAIVSADESGRIVSWNAGAQGIFGYTVEEAIGRPLGVVAHDGWTETLAGMVHGVPGAIGPRKLEIEGRRKDGTSIPLEASIATWRKDGRVYYGSILRDVSERKKLDLLKTEFISTVSHELRTPLTSIRGSLGLVLAGVSGQVAPKAKEMIQIAAKNCDRLVGLVNDILDIEKVASGKMVFKMRTFQLSGFLSQIVKSNRPYGETLGVGIELAAVPEGVAVHADSDRLGQVMTNLISNACKFSPRGERVRVSFERQEGKVRVSISDRGPGIPEEFRPRIFQKFAQAEAGSGAPKKGTGLGLAISKAFIERMGGVIGFSTELGKGTTFSFELPERKAGASCAGESSGRPRILICEDEPDIAAILRSTLDHQGFDTDIAGTIEEARALLGERPYAGMTLDLVLPDGSAVPFIRELRCSAPTAHLPVIVVSAYLDEVQRDLGGQAFGIVDWIEKPISTDRLSLALDAIRKGSGGRCPRILHVEDDQDVLQVVQGILKNMAEIDSAGTVLEAWEKLKREDYDLLLLDLTLPDGSGLELLPALGKNTGMPIPSLVFSAHEVSPRTAHYVSSALLKSRTSNEELLRRVKSLLRNPLLGAPGRTNSAKGAT
jgi:PAS domain S-box-containing protein